MAGQGTVALELLADAPEIDTLVVPIGGGGLISGIGTAAKGLKPGIEVIGVQAELYPSMYAKFTRRTCPAPATRSPKASRSRSRATLTAGIIDRLVDDILLVPERDIERAISLLVEIEKTVAEGAGATGLAALLAYPRALPRPQDRARPHRRQYRHAVCSPTCCCATSPARAGWRGCGSSSRTGPARSSAW